MDGKTIKRERKRRGWSQSELARRLDVGPRTVGAWERGENSPDRAQELLHDVFAANPPRTVPDEPNGQRLDSYSELALLGELMRRAVARGENGGTE